MSQQLRQPRPCPECGGERVKADASDEVRWGIQGSYSGAHGFDIVICTNCGYTTFYAQDFQDLTKLLKHPR